MKRNVLSLAALAAVCSVYCACEARVIALKPGVNRLIEPIVLGPEDSDTVIRGAPDGSSVLSGAVELKGLSFTKGEGGVWSARCELDGIDQLFVDGTRYDMARFPNSTEGKNVYGAWTLNETKNYRPEMDALLPERVKSWAHPETGYFHAMHASLWGDMHWRILGADEKGGLKLLGGWQNNRSSAPHEVFRFVENIREELDQPGEWFYDREAKRLFVIPKPGTDLSKAVVESVKLRTLVDIRGSVLRPVRGVRIENVSFTGAARTFMENREPLLRSDWTLCREAAVQFSCTEGCSIRKCTFRQLGGNAVIFDGCNKGAEVSETKFEEIGASGIVFAGRPDCVRSPMFNYSQKYDPSKMDLSNPGPNSESYPRDCRVSDCRFVRTGRDEKQTAAVQIAMSARISVLRCFIRQTPRAAINIGDGCFGGHLIEGCDVAETVLETGDHGAFNSWGRDRWWQMSMENFARAVAENPELPFLDAVEPTVIRGNKWRCDHGWDVDLDDGSSNYIIEDNEFLRGGLKLREGYRRIVRRNRAPINTLHRHCWPENCGDVIVSNVFARPFSDVMVRCREDGMTIQDNIILNPAQAQGGNRTMAWGGGRVRVFDGEREFSAFGVVPETKGMVVVVAPSGTEFKAGDLLVDVTEKTLPALPLASPVRIIRNQGEVTVSPR